VCSLAILSSNKDKTTPKMDLPDISLPILDAIDHNVIHNPSYSLFCYETESGDVEEVIWERAGTAFNVAARSISNVPDSAADPLSPIGIIANLGTSIPNRVVSLLIYDLEIDSTTFYSIIVGVLKAGRVPFLISIRNTPEAIANLLYLTKCTIILSTSDMMTVNLVTASVKLFEESSSFKVHRISAPTFAQLYGPDVVPTSPPTVDKKTKDEVMDTPCVLSHSSGTTSLPKPIMLTHRMINQVGFRNRMSLLIHSTTLY
jgi:acyl-CoA synthetase (AMP-forming)/AMP-acid ligase II